MNEMAPAPGGALTPGRNRRPAGVGPPRWNEVERLAALHSYAILDTPVEAAFADFVAIAAEVCEAPIAVVNLVDAARQWFPAEIGLGVRETPLEVSICAHAILQNDVFIIPDLTRDARFDCNPLVAGEPRLRFYAGALLETPEGLPLGTMCVLDYVPRPDGLTDRQTRTLQALARQVMARLELRRALRLRADAEADKDAAIAALAAALADKEAALAEKDLLMQEVHHRVKNGLAMVQSLLLLQARATGDAAAARQLRESAGRVHTVGAMHEQLYRVGASSHVDVADYLRNLVADQQAALASTLDGRAVTFAADSALWPASEAPALGMIAVELVTNALKYGVGMVRVTLRQAGADTVLTVEDEGAGLPPGFDTATGKGLGMRVVNGLLQGRGGRLALDRGRGHTCFVATLPVPPAPVLDARAA